MDNLLAGILLSSLKKAKIPWLSRVSYRYQHSFSGVAGFTGMGGRFQTEWVAGFHRNRWPAWTGILIQPYRNADGSLLWSIYRFE
jgi:hypothetical protein